MGQIDLQFAGSSDLGGQVIEWYDHGRFAHVDVVLPSGKLLGARSEVIGDVPAGVQVRPASYLSNTVSTLKVNLECTDEVSNRFYQFVSEQIGKPYDWEAIVGFVAGRQWMQPDSWFCSELVAAGLVQSGFVHQLSAPANKIAPDDLLLVCSAFVDIPLGSI